MRVGTDALPVLCQPADTALYEMTPLCAVCVRTLIDFGRCDS